MYFLLCSALSPLKHYFPLGSQYSILNLRRCPISGIQRPLEESESLPDVDSLKEEQLLSVTVGRVIDL